MSEREELKSILQQKSIRKGDFVLASGKRSTFYLDCRTTTLDPRGAYLVGRLMLEMLKQNGIRADAIGGPAVAAIPVVSAVAVVSGLEGTPLPAFFVRKEAKQHGTGRQIEGFAGAPGSRVVLVDDTCTTGESVLVACDRAEEAGYKVVAVLCVVDREEGGAENIAVRYPFYSLFTAKELL